MTSIYKQMDVQEAYNCLHIPTLNVHFTTVALQGEVKVFSMTNQRNSE